MFDYIEEKFFLNGKLAIESSENKDSLATALYLVVSMEFWKLLHTFFLEVVTDEHVTLAEKLSRIYQGLED